jgi:glycosyltransferase involved in cell wall biosynthesis
MQVVVLMSTYQGAPYVVEQLASILAQLPPDGRIVVRDDGSTDGTPDKVQALGDARITLQRGSNIGFVRSFLTLLSEAPADADMVMLADQDDVWLPHKIARAWEHLAPLAGTPALYCSRLQLVDAQLRPLGLSPLWQRRPSFENALTENIVTGCTAAMNPAALRLVRRCGDPQLIHFHDWWLYLVVAAFGKVVYDPEPGVHYRQHGGNVIGMGSGFARYLAIVRFVRKTSWVHIMYRQIGNFKAVFSDALDPQQRNLLGRYFDPANGMAVARLLLLPKRYRQSLLGDILFRGLLVAELLNGRGLTPK